MAIFAEPDPNTDETWTQGAMLGGMSGYDERDLAESYFLAGDTLTAVVADHKQDARELVNPVLYVYRHGIELYLKCILQPRADERDHNLGALLERFCQHVRDRYGEQVPTWVTEPISEFITYDPASTVFRYDAMGTRLQNAGEFWVDLPTARATMGRLRRAFRRVIVADDTGRIPFPGEV